MEFAELLEIAGNEPVLEASLLLAGDVDRNDVRRQLSRWVAAGRLVQLRRGLYALGLPFRRVEPHPFLVANHLVPGSYVSRHSALAHYGLIPEHVALTTSVGPGRPRRWQTPLGGFDFRHLHRRLLFGCEEAAVTRDQKALMATPEKALLDLVYLEPEADSEPYLTELRLQNLDRLEPTRLWDFAERSRKPKLRRAAERILRLAGAEVYETL